MNNKFHAILNDYAEKMRVLTPGANYSEEGLLTKFLLDLHDSGAIEFVE